MSSTRQYLTIAELEEYADITVLDNAEALDRIRQAEEMIDQYVGPQPKSLQGEVTGLAVSATSNSLTLQQDDQNVFQKNYFLYCQIKIIGGTGSGQERTISASTYAGVVTVSESWTTTPDNTSFYLIYQLAKFPRQQDMHYYATSETYQYLKTIPENIKRATAAQVEYMIQMGDEYFKSDKWKMNSESIGDYRYQKSPVDGGSIEDLIAPKTRLLLKGYKNRRGSFYVDR